MKVAMNSMDIAWENKRVNSEWCQKSVAEAAENQADVILFPEMTLTGFSMQVNKIQDKDGESVRFFSELAKEYNIAIGFGYVTKNGEKGRNHFCLVNRKGKVLEDYEKIHPFSYGGESSAYEGGERICHARLEDLTCGLFICYDLRFPEAFQQLPMDTDAVFIIANWPKERLAHWYTLLMARAIEMQCYVVGVNRTGAGGGLEYRKSSIAIAPEGIPVPTEQKECNRYVELSKEARRSYVKGFPTRKDRRPDIYRA
ncbi:MAG: carbon-nitrogen family hydrolase [Lachnospiraceae bacterium]|nr:carbon-nitrogen family hydrolase [Lachnospiraceae bacterium]